MPPRSAIERLPEELKAELDRRLVASGFGGYVALSEWLAAQGYQIGKSSIHKYGTAFEKKLGALRIASEQAKAIAEAVGDDQNAMGEALVNLAQEKAFGVLLDMQIDPEQQDFSRLTRSIAELNRAAVQQKKFAEEAREKVAAKLAALEAEQSSGQPTLDAATLQRVREEIYGIFS